MKPRVIKLSKTFNDQLVQQIDYSSEQRFGRCVADEKKDRVLATIGNILADNPAITRPHEVLDLVVYPISETSFFILYDDDDHELRVHFIFRAGASLDDLDPASAEW